MSDREPWESDPEAWRPRCSELSYFSKEQCLKPEGHEGLHHTDWEFWGYQALLWDIKEEDK